MKENVFDILKERGYLKQCTDEVAVRELLGKEAVTFYIGFDPTADSLHVGHFIQMMVMSHMQKHGHIPLALLGGGTTMVGDPSGKTDMRKMLTKEDIAYNASVFKKQFERLIEFSDGKALMDNNANWLLNLNYIEFLREIGASFSVNRMLTAECYKNRMEKGLTFFEFNYMIMQAYDFLVLNRKYGCKLQMGGDDQWSNIIAGADLIRRKEGKEAYGMTFTLLTTSEGVKMGKTVGGALWLDAEKTSPYEFYQYWISIADADVHNCLSLLTFIPMDEVNRLSSLEGAEINKAKKVLAYEVTKLIHGEEEAKKAEEATAALFGGQGNMDNVPSSDMTKAELNDGMNIVDMLVWAKLAPSKSEGRRLVEQGGILLNGDKVEQAGQIVKLADFKDNSVMIKKGKKVFHKINLV